KQRRETPGRNREDRDVPITDTPGATVERAGDLDAARLDQPAHPARQHPALEPAILFHLGLLGAFEVEWQHCHGGCARTVAAGCEGLVEHGPGSRIEPRTVR